MHPQDLQDMQHPWRRRLARAVTLLAMAGATMNAAWGAPVTMAQVRIIPSFGGGTGLFEQTTQAIGTVSLNGSATGGFNSSGTARAQVQWGVIQVEGSAAGALSASAWGAFQDRITISAPGVAAGTPGSLRYAVHVLGSLAVDASNSRVSTG